MRNRFINVRFTDEEIGIIDMYRKETALTRSTFVRESALGRPPRVIPSINRDQWASLARLASCLNQLSHEANLGHFHTETETVIKDTMKLLSEVRTQLIGG